MSPTQTIEALHTDLRKVRADKHDLGNRLFLVKGALELLTEAVEGGDPADVARTVKHARSVLDAAQKGR